MKIDELLVKVNARLGRFFAAHQFILFERLYDEARPSHILRWHNSERIVEIYLDVAGGEVNSRIANVTADGGDVAWQYLYELSPLSEEELDLAHKSFRTFDDQLDTICRKLVELFERQ